jgi:hypothetical protein
MWLARGSAQALRAAAGRHGRASVGRKWGKVLLERVNSMCKVTEKVLED